jgi:hypothetical protein
MAVAVGVDDGAIVNVEVARGVAVGSTGVAVAVTVAVGTGVAVGMGVAVGVIDGLAVAL